MDVFWSSREQHIHQLSSDCAYVLYEECIFKPAPKIAVVSTS